MSTPSATEALPQYHPSARELDDLELLLDGAFAPVTSFNEPGSPVTLDLPPMVAAAAAEAGGLELVDPEGLPLAVVTVPAEAVEPAAPVAAAASTSAPAAGPVGWPVRALTHAQYGPFRRLHLSVSTVRERYAGSTFVPVTDALTAGQVAELTAIESPVVLLALMGAGTPALSPVGLLRASLAAAGTREEAAVVAVPLASHGDQGVDDDLTGRVVANYAGPDPIVRLADHGDGLPEEVAGIVAFDRPDPERRGLVLFFTGLSGSGKSTVARAVMDTLLEQGQRTVTSLDGDVVRRHLSAGLTFSKEDRETNIRRIGWVAAEISRHGGVAICSPIAPFDATRQQVRRMVEEAGGAFLLVHVATPLAECERRDRKGLYAKARRGEIPEFTGISSPYEEPKDARLRIDTTGRSIEDCRDAVLEVVRQDHLIH